MQEIYSYVFWHNYLDGNWYAIPKDEYLIFFSGDKVNATGVIKSTSIKTLISIIENPEFLDDIEEEDICNS